MTNEYGEKLDRNGYAESIVEDNDRCFLCGRSDRMLNRHEVYHGSNRQKSKRLGLWVNLCDLCHDKLHHKDANMDLDLKQKMQIKAMEVYGWSIEQFREITGKNYL